jgi:SNF2 family DNA or RNA helicase
MLGELLDEGHSALIFSQFTSMLAIIEEYLKQRQVTYYKITGETSTDDRAMVVREFNADERPAVCLLSLRAAGVGLTLTKADYVFIYDPWWNPAVENQAIDRTHRIGQTKPVIAYRLVAQDSIEEKVLSLQDEKRRLFAATLEGGTDLASSQLNRDELISLLQGG